jgi:FkbM family methyltransferase
VTFRAFWNKSRRAVAAIQPTRLVAAFERRVKRIVWAILPSFGPDSYLKYVNGVIHVGANVGQERRLYANHKLKVLWIEPLPDVFERLCNNISSFPGQLAVNRLITDKDGVAYDFHIANNGGISSSILHLAQHRDIWPDVHYVSKLTLKSISLDSLLKSIDATLSDYQALVIDTQGSELLVLKGATKSLGRIAFVKTEAADFESYRRCARVEELTAYLARFGFELVRSDKFAESPNGGRYFDLLYRKSRVVS